MRALALALTLVTLVGCELVFRPPDADGQGSSSGTSATSGTTSTTSGTTGSGELLHWTPMDFTGGSGLYAVSGNAANNVYAVGSDGIIGRWDGSAWGRVAQEAGNLTLTSVYVAPEGVVYAAGGTHLLRCAAPCTQQSDLKESPVDGVMTAVCGGGGEIYAVGNQNNATNLGVLFRYDAGSGTWSELLESIYDAPSLAACWVAPGGAVYLAGQDRIFSFEAGVATPEPIEGAGDHLGTQLFSFWGTGSALFASGTGQTLLSRDGSGTWHEVFTPAFGFDLRALAGSGSSEAFAVGSGTLAHFDGSSWTLAPSATLTGSTLWGLWAAGPGEYFAVGAEPFGAAPVIFHGVR